DLTRLVVAVVEERHGHIERIGDLLQTRRANAIDALLVLLDLLEADAELLAEFRLRDLLFDSPQPDTLAKFDVGLARATLFHSLCCCFVHSLLRPSVEKPPKRWVRDSPIYTALNSLGWMNSSLNQGNLAGLKASTSQAIVL